MRRQEHTSGIEDRLADLESRCAMYSAQLRMMFLRMSMIEEGAVVPDEVPSPNVVQRNVDAVIDDMAKGRTSKPQEDALGRALQDRKVGRAFGR